VQKRSIQWDDLQTFAAVHRGGSNSAAARELGLTHATVGRRLRDLEEAAGSALLERDDTGLVLTATGRTVLAAAETMDNAASALTRQLQGNDATLRGRVRLTCTEGFGTDLLPRHLPSLHARHPALELELVVDARTLSLSRRRADMAIRLARPQEENLVTRHLTDIHYHLCCAPDQHAKMRAALRAGRRLPLCRYDSSLAALPESLWLDEHQPDAQIVLLSNSLLTLSQACAAGTGAALLPVNTAQRLGLTLLETPSAPVRSTWLAYPAEYRNVPRFRAVADWLVEVFQAEPAWG
jgi:DNA-binding transcriptional LysR family regulator